jgi:hypothetical protein
MRAYVLGKLTDKQIREIHAEAERDFKQEKERAKAEADAFWARHQKEVEKCEADVAYKARYPGCGSLPITWLDIGKPAPGRSSVDECFENRLMGFCSFARTVHHAKELGCLPR